MDTSNKITARIRAKTILSVVWAISALTILSQAAALNDPNVERTTRSDGTVSMTLPNGIIREERPDGSVWESVNSTKDLVDGEIISLASWRRRVEPGDKVIFSGKLLKGYSDPWASVLLPGGEIINLKSEAFSIKGDSFELPVVMRDGVGRYRIEIIVKCALGNKVAMNVSVWAGTDPFPEDSKPVLYRTIEPIEPLNRIEGKLYEMINRERQKRGFAVVRWDSETGQLARNMARDMVAGDFFGHISPQYGNIGKRAIKLFKWQTLIYGTPTTPSNPGTPNRIADDIITARSLGGAIETLLDSPAHRAVLLCPYWTSAGVGVSRLNKGDGRDVAIVIAMLQLNRPKTAPPPPKKTVTNEDDKIYYGVPLEVEVP